MDDIQDKMKNAVQKMYGEEVKSTLPHTHEGCEPNIQQPDFGDEGSQIKNNSSFDNSGIENKKKEPKYALQAHHTETDKLKEDISVKAS